MIDANDDRLMENHRFHSHMQTTDDSNGMANDFDRYVQHQNDSKQEIVFWSLHDSERD